MHASKEEEEQEEERDSSYKGNEKGLLCINSLNLFSSIDFKQHSLVPLFVRRRSEAAVMCNAVLESGLVPTLHTAAST